MRRTFGEENTVVCSQKALMSLFLLVPCEEQAGGDEAVQAALAHPARPAADVQRDTNRKPDEVLSFFGIEPGQEVLEVFSGGGYYTQILDALVGPDGKVIAHNNAGYMDFVGPQFESRFLEGGMANTEQLLAEANDIQLEAGSLDAALMVLTYHDFLFGSEQFNWPDVDEAAFLDGLCSAMKPGAVLGVIDHVANPEDDPVKAAFDIHRIDPERVMADITGSCFDFVESSDCLQNPNDDHTTSATQGPLAGNTDRFVYKFVRR